MAIACLDLLLFCAPFSDSAVLSRRCRSRLQPNKQPFRLRTSACRTLNYLDGKRNRPVLVELRYPTDQSSGSNEISLEEESVLGPSQRIEKQPIVWSNAKYPLIVMSHGHRGDRRERRWRPNIWLRTDSPSRLSSIMEIPR